MKVFIRARRRSKTGATDGSAGNLQERRYLWMEHSRMAVLLPLSLFSLGNQKGALLLLFKGGVNSGDSFLPGLGVCLCLWAEAGYVVTWQVLRSSSWKPVASRVGTTSAGCLLHAEELQVAALAACSCGPVCLWLVSPGW